MIDIFAEFAATANRQPESIAIASAAGAMRYGVLLQRVASSFNAAGNAGLRPGQLVVVDTANPDARLAICLSLMLLGCRVGYNRDMRVYAAADIAIDAVVGESSQSAHHKAVSFVTVGPDWFRTPADVDTIIARRAADFSLLVSSSGSTGTPKLIELDSHGIAYRVAEKMSDPYLGEAPRYLVLSGDATTTTFQDTLIALIKGGIVIRPASRTGAAILDAVQLLRPDYCVMAPITLADVLAVLHRSPRAIARIGSIRVAGAYCSPALQRAALDRIADTLTISYGATEIGRVAWGYSVDLQRTEGSVGRIVDGVEVATFDDSGRRLPPGSSGAIRIKVPPGTPATYPGNGMMHSDTWRDGWFAPGDIGFVDRDGTLVIRGRLSNLINVGGNKVSAEEVEAEIGALDAEIDVAVVGVRGPDGIERICAAISGSTVPDIDAVNAHLRGRGSQAPVHRLAPVAAIPRTASGKIDRTAVRRLFGD